MTPLVLLGLSSGLCWGTADFFGGLQSRRLPVLSVALWSQIAGAIALALVLLSNGRPPIDASIWWGIAGGIFSGTGLVLFYRGLARGVMSIVAPASACGALVPVLVSIASGQIPGLLAWVGMAASLGGIILLSLQADPDAHSARDVRATLPLALSAALCFGLFYVFLDRGSAVTGHAVLWTIAGARIGSLSVLLVLAVLGPWPAPWPGRRAPLVAGTGILDTTANALFAYASTQGNLGIAAVLASLYPAVTVLLGRVILSERLTRLQNTGVLCALAGVALLSTGN